ncbi:MAG: dihydrolipoamide acetyltransferase family protein [Saprospiraceae bacterium]|nr:dihydrolipoamide acetyltransferase family protein [Saprospiraceae bacterium]
MEHDLIMPKMGESITEATILKWLFREGDEVKLDQPILEIATDKVDSEIPSPVQGKITKILFQENDIVPVGTVIAKIQILNGVSIEPVKPSLSSNGHPEIALPLLEKDTSPLETEILNAAATVPYLPAEPDHSEPGKESAHNRPERFYSPLVRTIAKEENIALTELDQLAGSGSAGRVTKADILNYVEKKKSHPVLGEPDQVHSPRQGAIISGTTASGEHEIIEMDRMRRLIADHMVNSKNIAPHVTSFVEVDVTEIVLWRNKIKNAFQSKYDQNITFTPIFIEAVVQAIKQFPLINSSVEGYKIIKKKDINIGIATALPSGNLIVPVIKQADRLSLVGLTLAINDLARRARENQLKADEVSGGTFTLTNVGSFGSLMGTPIINQPQVAILATGAIKKKPAVLETVHGDVIAIRHFMFMSMSYDHRVIDGYLGGSFLRRVADLLESFDTQQTP